MITVTYPATFHEVGYRHAEQEQHPWYLVERDGVLGLAGEVEHGDEIVMVFE